MKCINFVEHHRRFCTKNFLDLIKYYKTEFFFAVCSWFPIIVYRLSTIIVDDLAKQNITIDLKEKGERKISATYIYDIWSVVSATASSQKFIALIIFEDFSIFVRKKKLLLIY